MPLTISLHCSNEVSIQEQVYVREIGGGSSVHHHLIQYLQICGREEKKQFTHQTIFNLPQPPCLLIWCHPLAPHCWICASTNICQKPLTSYVRSELHFANDSVCSCCSLNSRLTACRRLLWRRPSQDEQTALASRFDLFLARAQAARGAGPCSYVTKTFIGEPEALTYRGTIVCESAFCSRNSLNVYVPMRGGHITWYCMALRLLSMSPLVKMIPFSSTLAFFSQFSLSTRTFKRLLKTMAALPAISTNALSFLYGKITHKNFQLCKKNGKICTSRSYKHGGWKTS